ncbi:hypothetical protein R50072_22750 [Simiduia litorea]
MFTVCQTTSENQQLAATLSFTTAKSTLVQASQYLAKTALEEQRVKGAEREAQQAAYRRIAKSDQMDMKPRKLSCLRSFRR